jgi:hypothetical protein
MLKTIVVILILSGLYYFDDQMLDLADFKCKVYRDNKIGYPVRACALSFDDRGVIGRAITHSGSRR